jgi:hypothetical protein
VAQVAIAWVAAQGTDIVPLVGARRRDQLDEALGALDVPLTPADISAIEQAVPKGAAAGERYAREQMATLDSELPEHEPPENDGPENDGPEHERPQPSAHKLQSPAGGN